MEHFSYNYIITFSKRYKKRALTMDTFFVCRPEVQINWEKTGSNNLPPSHTVQAYNTELHINPVSLTDDTVYSCTGSNLAGTSSQDIRVKVEG